MSKNAVLNDWFAAYDGKPGSISANPAKMPIGCIINKVDPVSANVDIPYFVLSEIIDIYVFLDSATQINTAYCSFTRCIRRKKQPSVTYLKVFCMSLIEDFFFGLINLLPVYFTFTFNYFINN